MIQVYTTVIQTRAGYNRMNMKNQQDTLTERQNKTKYSSRNIHQQHINKKRHNIYIIQINTVAV